MIETIKLRAGLLIERAEGVFTFPHRTFQEYLAGAHLSTLPDFHVQAKQLIEQGDLWREVILLAVGRLVYLSGDTAKPLLLASELCLQQCDENGAGWRRAWFAGDVLLEMAPSRVRDTDTGRKLLDRARDLLARLVSEGRLAPLERAAAGRTLSKLGDPRRGVSILIVRKIPDIIWCHVPAGKFWMSSDKKQDSDTYEDEQPQHEIELGEFYLSRYPVTNAQFSLFVEDNGYRESAFWDEAQTEKLWSDEGFKGGPDDNWRTQQHEYGEPYKLANHPVVGVSWYEALAYCRWLNQKLLQAAQLLKITVWQESGSTEKIVSINNGKIFLPSEAQWEKAARSDDQRIYPWGREISSDQANYNDTKINTTCSVGSFPKGESLFGLLDASGNVREWTSSLHKNYPYKSNDGREKMDADKISARVLRGGAFFCSARDVRCACRSGYSPNYRGRPCWFSSCAVPRLLTLWTLFSLVSGNGGGRKLLSETLALASVSLALQMDFKDRYERT